MFQGIVWFYLLYIINVFQYKIKSEKKLIDILRGWRDAFTVKSTCSSLVTQYPHDTVQSSASPVGRSAVPFLPLKVSVVHVVHLNTFRQNIHMKLTKYIFKYLQKT